MSAAYALLAEASAAGVRVRLTGTGGLRAPADAPAELLTRLRGRKAELAALLAGEACRHCGGAIEARLPGWIPFTDGTAAHLACYEVAEAERLHARAACCFAPDVLADEAEVTMRGESLP